MSDFGSCNHCGSDLQATDYVLCNRCGRDRIKQAEAELAAERKKNEFLRWLVKQMREALEYVRDNTGEEGIFVAAREALEGKETEAKWKIGSTSDFLSLTKEEEELIKGKE